MMRVIDFLGYLSKRFLFYWNIAFFVMVIVLTCFKALVPDLQGLDISDGSITQMIQLSFIFTIVPWSFHVVVESLTRLFAGVEK